MVKHLAKLLEWWSRPHPILTFSKCTLKDDGQRWVRLGHHGPGIRIYDPRVRALLFSLRYGYRKHLKLGPYVVVWLPGYTPPS